MVDAPPTGMVGHSVPSSTRPSVPSTNPTQDRMWASYRPRGGSYPVPRDGTAPVPLSSHSTLPNLGVPTSYGNKRPSPSNAGESEKEDMDEDSEGNGSRGLGLGGDDDSFTVSEFGEFDEPMED